jgi:hypothetical protein
LLDRIFDLQGLSAVLLSHQVPPEFDLLSLRQSCNEYWLWNALNISEFSPRVVVVEMNAHIALAEPITSVYNASAGGQPRHRACGSSVAALVHLASSRGYSLVHCEAHGASCFFVRDDILFMSELDVSVKDTSPSFTPTADRHWSRDVSSIYEAPNFFGRGWGLPEIDQKASWVWVK